MNKTVNKYPYSISFLNGMADCAHQQRLRKFKHILRDTTKLQTYFGSRVHEVFQLINLFSKNKCLPCNTCKHSCKLNTAEQTQASFLSSEQCKIQEVIESILEDALSDENVKYIREAAKNKVTFDKKLLKMRKLGAGMIKEVLFNKMPVGKVVLVEEHLEGTLGEFKVHGYPDLIMNINNEAIVYDYKTRGSKQSDKDFPMAQACLYSHLLRQKGAPVRGIGTVYLISTGVTEIEYIDIVENAQRYEHTLAGLLDDMRTVQKMIDNDIFPKNRKSMFCPCDYADICEYPDKIELAAETAGDIKTVIDAREKQRAANVLKLVHQISGVDFPISTLIRDTSNEEALKKDDTTD